MTSCGFGNDFHLLQKEASLMKKWRRLAPGTNSSLSIWFYFLITHNYRKKYFYLSIIISVKEYSLLCHSFNRLCNSSKKHLFIFNILLWDTYIFILLHKINNFNKNYYLGIICHSYASKKNTTWSRQIHCLMVPNCCAGIQRVHKIST